MPSLSTQAARGLRTFLKPGQREGEPPRTRTPPAALVVLGMSILFEAILVLLAAQALL